MLSRFALKWICFSNLNLIWMSKSKCDLNSSVFVFMLKHLNEPYCTYTKMSQMNQWVNLNVLFQHTKVQIVNFYLQIWIKRHLIKKASKCHWLTFWLNTKNTKHLVECFAVFHACLKTSYCIFIGLYRQVLQLIQARQQQFMLQ